MNTIESLFLSQLRILFAKNVECDSCIQPPNEEEFSELLRLSAEHSVTPIMTEAMFKSGILTGDAADVYRQISYMSFVKWQKQEAEFEKITAIFEKMKIHYMPLKGAVIRQLYPEAWMRTSCDVDILVQEEQLSAARKVLIEELDYQEDNKTDHDIMLIAPNGVQLELHYDFSEKQISVNQVWETALKKEGTSCYEMSPEWFYLHHLAHMAKHFTLGGCGIRPMIDLYLMQQHMPCDKNRLCELLKQNNLNVFADKIFDILSAWMEEKMMTDVQQKILSYIVSGGVYGDLDNKVAVAFSRNKNVFRYVFRRIFPVYDSMIYLYPIVRKYRILVPFCHIHRWIHLLNRKKLKKAEAELKNVQVMGDGKLDETQRILYELGL